MYKRVCLFLLIVFLVLCAFGGTTLFCYNMLANNEKIEDASIYTNIIEGWNNTFGEPVKVLNEFYYVEPIGQIIFATDANNNYMYSFGDGERFYDMKTKTFAKDKNNNYIYASAGDSTYNYMYYATSCNKNYEYMYANSKGGLYYNFKNYGDEMILAKNSDNQEIKYDDEKLNKLDDVNFNKDAKVYYLVSIVAGGIGLSVLIGLLITYIVGKINDKKLMVLEEK